MATTSKRRRAVPDALRALIRPVSGQPWAIDRPSLQQIVEISRDPAAFAAADLQALGFGGSSSPAGSGPVRVIPIFGAITNHASIWSEYFGGASVDRLRVDLAAALGDPTVRAVMFQIASPGGEVMGMTEFAAELRALRGGAKPIVAMIDPYCHSAAYWIAAQCDEVVITTSGTAGSVGIYTVYDEYSGALEKAGITETVIGSSEEKTEALGVEPLSSEAEQAIRDLVMAHAAMFTSDVAKGRGVGADAVSKTFGGGRVLMAKDALAVGMVDRVDTMANTYARLAKTSRPSAARADADAPDLVAETPADSIPFGDRVARVAAEAAGLLVHAQERARLREKEGRTPLSSKVRDSLGSTRAALGVLLSLDADDAQPVPDSAVEPQEPVASATSQVVEPPKTKATPSAPAPAARAPRPPMSDEDWLAHLERELVTQ